MYYPDWDSKAKTQYSSSVLNGTNAAMFVCKDSAQADALLSLLDSRSATANSLAEAQGWAAVYNSAQIMVPASVTAMNSSSSLMTQLGDFTDDITVASGAVAGLTETLKLLVPHACEIGTANNVSALNRGVQFWPKVFSKYVSAFGLAWTGATSGPSALFKSDHKLFSWKFDQPVTAKGIWYDIYCSSYNRAVPPQGYVQYKDGNGNWVTIINASQFYSHLMSYTTNGNTTLTRYLPFGIDITAREFRIAITPQQNSTSAITQYFRRLHLLGPSVPVRNDVVGNQLVVAWTANLVNAFACEAADLGATQIVPTVNWANNVISFGMGEPENAPI